MTCVFCGGHSFERREVDCPIYQGDRIVGVVTVVADVCLQCGEPYFDADAVKQIDAEAKRLREQQAQPVTSTMVHE